MTVPRLCSKCQAHVRVQGQRWCRECRAQYKRLSRGTTPGIETTARQSTPFGGSPTANLGAPPPPSGRQHSPGAPQRARRRLLDYDECAAIAGVSPHTIARACLRRELPYRLMTWRRRNFTRKKRMILDVDLLSWIYLRPHPLPQRRAWREPDAGTESSPS